MNIYGYNLKPVSIFLNDDEKWRNRYNKAKEYFASEGIDDILWVQGVHAENSGLQAARPYLKDTPDGSYFIEQKTIGVNVSVAIAHAVMLSHPEVEHWLFLEDDCRFIAGWRDELQAALQDVPADFDYLFGGSCCTQDKETINIKGNVYEVKYPFCGHISVIARKALPIVIDKQRNLCSPGDIEKCDTVFPLLKVYTILPRIAEQENTELPV